MLKYIKGDYMKQEKLIIFDWGGVIESHNDQEYCIKKATIDFFKSFKLNMEDEQIYENFKYCCNNVQNHSDKEELFESLKNTFNLTCNIEEFVEKYNTIISRVEYYKDVVDYAHSLKDKCKIGILSNLTPFDKYRINNQVNLSKFDYVWLSFELNCRKPNEKIYNIVESFIDIPSDNILFIDDLARNLEIPKSRGWNTCQAFGFELDKIKESVDNFLKNNE